MENNDGFLKELRKLNQQIDIKKIDNLIEDIVQEMHSEYPENFDKDGNFEFQGKKKQISFMPNL